jgi:hypothetical protein
MGRTKGATCWTPRRRFALLLISFSVTRKESKWFSLAPGRLVTTRSVEESHESGLGQDSASRTVTTVTVL